MPRRNLQNDDSSEDDMTADDLMRLQEDRARKRRRIAADHRPAPATKEGDDSKEEDEGVSRNGDDETQSEESDEDEETLEAEQPSTNSTQGPTYSRIVQSSIVSRTTEEQSETKHAKIKAVTNLSWTDMNIASPLRNALASMSIRAPTEIQSACIPPLLSGRDCIGNAKTGSGKTIAFALPILQKLSADPYGIFALVLTPTRELAFQIAEQFAVLGGAVNVRTAVIVGGMDVVAQALELGRRPHVVVATPGRLVDLLKNSSGEWDLSRVKFLVLDEADRLLTPTFAPELAYLFNAFPRDRQTCLFTATWTDDVDRIANTSPRPGKQKPFIYRIRTEVETVATLHQFYLLVPSHVREAYLFHLLRFPPESTLSLRRAPPEPQEKGGRARKTGTKSKNPTDPTEIIQPPPTIIFCNKPRGAAFVCEFLKTLGIRATALHSHLTQRERMSSLSLFRAAVVPVLVSTDVGARGLDIDDVAMVINWDLPREPEEYTHRVGRTARAGRKGVAISFVTERDEDKVLAIESRIHTKLAEIQLPENRVLEKLNEVSTARRVTAMALHDQNVGQRQKVHRAKQPQS